MTPTDPLATAREVVRAWSAFDIEYDHFASAMDALEEALAALPEGTAIVTVDSLVSELGMHHPINDTTECDCGDWRYTGRAPHFNDHVAAAIIQAAKEADAYHCRECDEAQKYLAAKEAERE